MRRIFLVLACAALIDGRLLPAAVAADGPSGSATPAAAAPAGAAPSNAAPGNATPVSVPAPPALRLPTGARPRGYEVVLTVVPGAPTVAGTIVIDLELDTPHAFLWLNADELKVTRASVDRDGVRATPSNGHDQFVGIAFDPPLPAGRHRLELAFEGPQVRNSARGVFALEDAGAWYAMTQFEATSARRAFPCFDEPVYKVPWQLTLRVPRDAIALSNTPPESTTPADEGLVAVRFARTRPLPSYLVAFAVGPWEFVDLGPVGVHGTPMRIVVPRGRRADAGFAARTYPELFARLETWFGIPYPYGKLDQVAIPLTVGFAMENAGLVTYGAPTLLAKPGADAPRFRRNAANVGAHEMAHQWFGNLVTTGWWDDIWLNEAFATWLAAKTVHDWRPDYDRDAARIWERAEAIDGDVLATARRIREPIVTRGDIFRAFDGITYRKGATVIGMFEGWMGEASFRRGVRAYLESRRDGTATAADFLDALARASREPVRPAFETFLDQNGIPRVDATLVCDRRGARVELAQQRLLLLGSEGDGPRRWRIPVCARYGTGGVARQACTLLAGERATLALEGRCPAWVFANAGGRGYFVPRHDGSLADALAKHTGALTEPEFASLVLDQKVLVGSGAVRGAQALDWVRRGAASPWRHVQVAAIELAGYVGSALVDDAQRGDYVAFMRANFGPRARALGFVPRPGEGDDAQLLRRTLLRVMAPLDPALAAQARRLARDWLRDRRAVDPGLVDVVLATAARTGDAALFDALEAEARRTTDRQDRAGLMFALFSFEDPALARRGHALLLDPAFDVRESWTALYKSHGWQPARRATAEFIAANFDALAQTVSREAPGGWPGFAESLCTDDDARALADVWKDRARGYAAAAPNLAAALDAIRSCARVRAQAGDLGLAVRRPGR